MAGVGFWVFTGISHVGAGTCFLGLGGILGLAISHLLASSNQAELAAPQKSPPFPRIWPSTGLLGLPQTDRPALSGPVIFAPGPSCCADA